MKAIIILFTLSILVSCTSPRMMETNLYFGLLKPAGGMVSEAKWNGFKENNISKIFKEGFSIVNVSGSWYDKEKQILITEPTYKVIYLHKKSSALSKQIDSLRQHYKILFQQQAVLRVDKKVQASF